MTIPLVGPDGRKYEVDEKNLDGALKLGYRVETPEAPQTALEEAADLGKEAVETSSAATTGALRGASVGLSDVALSQSNPEATKLLRGFEEQHPLAAGAGELAGAVLSPVNKVAPLVEGERAATVAGRLGQKALGGMAVGTLFGAGNAVSEAALDNVPLTAEKLVAHAGLGMLLGGAGGGLGGAIEESASGVLPKMATMFKRSGSTLDDIADDFTLKSFRNTKSELSKFTDQQLEDAVRVTRERGHMALSPEEMGKSLGKDVEQTGMTKGAFLDVAETNGTRPDYRSALKALDDFQAGLPPLERESIAADIKSARTALEDIATDPAPEKSGWRAFDKWKQNLQAKAKFSKGPAGQDDLVLPLKRQLAGVARSELDRQLVPALGQHGQPFLETKELYGALKTAQRLAASGSKRPGGFSLGDIGAAVIGGNLHPAGIVGALGTKLLREHGAAIVARVADSLSKSAPLTAVARSFAASLPEKLPQMGQFGPSLLQAAARSPAHALAEHIVNAHVDPSYAATAQMAGLTPEQPDQHVAALGKATELAAIHGAAQAHDKAIDEGLQHVVKGTKPPKGATVLKTQDFGSKQLRQDARAAHQKRVEEVRRFAADPQALVDRVAGNTGELAAAPAVQAHLTAVAHRAVKYLAKQAETPQKPGPLGREWVATDAERHVFALQLEAVQEPMSVLRHAAAGTLTKQQLDAVLAVYPSLHAQLAEKAADQLMSGEDVPYRARLMLSLLAGIDADGTLSPQSIAMNQKAIAAAKLGSQKPSEQPQPLSDVKLGQAERMALPGDKRQLGRDEA